MRGRAFLRIAAVSSFVAVLLALTAAPASAHTISGPRPTNYRSHFVSMTPDVPGISVRVVDLGAKLELTNRTDTEVLVLGYEDEPYLRIGPNGVFENLHSQATYLNRTRLGGTVPVGVDTSPDAEPEWKKIGDGNSHRWHDHRIHWMSAQPPPTVQAAPDQFNHLSTQRITFVHDGRRVIVAVALDWVPGPTAWPWLIPILLLFALGVVVAVMPNWWRTLAALVVVLVLFDMLHAITYEIARPGTNLEKALQFVGGSFVSIAVWIAAVPTVIGLLRRRIEALYGVVFVGLLIALVGGMTDLSALWKSQLPGAGPDWLTRTEVVVALGLGSGLVVGALVRMVRSSPRKTEEGRGQWLSLLVSGLNEDELSRIVGELDPDEVLEFASRDLAERAAPIAARFAAGSVALVADDYEPAVEWSVSLDATPGELVTTRGRAAPVQLEMRAAFPTLLQLLAGTLTVDEARARSRLTVTGDVTLLDDLAPYLSEVGPTRAVTGDPAPAS